MYSLWKVVWDPIYPGEKWGYSYEDEGTTSIKLIISIHHVYVQHMER